MNPGGRQPVRFQFRRFIKQMDCRDRTCIQEIVGYTHSSVSGPAGVVDINAGSRPNRRSHPVLWGSLAEPTFAGTGQHDRWSCRHRRRRHSSIHLLPLRTELPPSPPFIRGLYVAFYTLRSSPSRLVAGLAVLLRDHRSFVFVTERQELIVGGDLKPVGFEGGYAFGDNPGIANRSCGTVTQGFVRASVRV